MRLISMHVRGSASGRGRVGVFGWVCGLLAAAGARADEPPTYTRDVAPILQAKCQGCHRKGEVGPFVLSTYEQARKRAADIVSVVEERQMPPWKPVPGVGPRLKHDPSLSASEVETLRAWADAGAPRGDEAHLPPPPQFCEGWRLGEPDLVLEPAEDFTVPAGGPDLYRCFVIPTDLPKDTYIAALEFRPGNRQVVHHLSVFIDTKGFGRRLDAADPGPGYTSYLGPGFEVAGELGFWNAGNPPLRMPEGVGMALPKGADVVMQVHYHPGGKPATDRTRIGVHLARRPVKQQLHWGDATNIDFKLPAGKDDIEVKASWFVPADVEAVAVSPHMHLLGREMRMFVTYPSGRKVDLIHVDDWDPAWQGTYFFEHPISLPRGSVVHVAARYDNSDHARNPNQPPRTVRTGYKVEDEMCVGYIAVVKKGQDLTRAGTRDDLHVVFEQQRLRKLRKYLADKRGF